MISIVGSGPAGTYTAGLLAKEGFSTEVYEEHNTIGKPIQCTGITTIYLNNVLTERKIESEGFLVNTISKTRVFAPDNSSVDITLKKNYIVDRTRFDQYLADLAQSAGAKIHCGKKFITGSRSSKKIKLKFNNETKETDALIGADGPFSAVAKAFNMYGNRRFALGAQARMQMNETFDPNVVEFFLGKGYFGWLVPETERIARVGIASNEKAKHYFDELLKKRPGEILEWQSGPIPVYNPRLPTEQGNVFLIGDAATQVKATTYGGIIPAMMAAPSLVTAIKHQKSYQRLWKQVIGRELWLHLAMRKLLDRFTDRDCNRLINLTSQAKITKVLTEHDREFPCKILAKMLIREPRFLSFAPRIFSSLAQ